MIVTFLNRAGIDETISHSDRYLPSLPISRLSVSFSLSISDRVARGDESPGLRYDARAVFA